MEVLSPDKASKWVTNSNEAVQIRLVSGANPHGIQSALHKINTTSVGDDSLDQDSEGLESIDLVQFHPVFTYPIYGTQERIFGYKGLHVDINVSAGSLRTQMRVRYSKRVEDMESTSLVKLKSDDVYGPIRKILPDGKGADMEPAASLVRRYGQQHSLTEYIDALGSIDLISDEEEFARVVAEDTEEFRPMGSKIHEYRLEDSSGSVFEVYENSFSSEKFKQFHSRMQPFILFFIEGGTFIDTDDERWRVYTLFEKWDFEGSTGYSFIGYLTMYRFFHWPDKLRARISQFLILPPFQEQGHGSRLYNCIRDLVLHDSEIVDLTVEDPSEMFDDLRDKNDMRYLVAQNVFAGLEAPVRRDTIDRIQEQHKMSRRQLIRCIEIGLLKSLDKTDKDKYRRYRLFVKRRLYSQNSDILASLPPHERKEKLEETYRNIEEDYHRILNML